MNFLQNLRRYARLSPKKKFAAVGVVFLLAMVVAAAYARNLWLLTSFLAAFGVTVLYAVVRLDRRLRAARRAALRAARAGARPASDVSVPQMRPGALAWWGQGSSLPRRMLVQRLTKLRTVEGRDVLVSSATSGSWSWADMASGLEMYRLGGKTRERVKDVLEAAVPSALAHLADLCFRQNILKDDILNAATLYAYVYEKVGAKPFVHKRRGEFFLDALARTGQGSAVIRLQGLYNTTSANANDLHLYRANAANPHKDASADFETWLNEINAVYEKAGLARLSLREGSESPFLRLAAETPEPETEGPLVSVVMPVYRPDEYTDLAIQSAVDQSHRNLEIIIVDDGSGGDAAERLNKWANADKRIRVLLNPENSGAYTSRNLGYSMASGEFLTIFDGDDWQHPQKIELLVRAAEQQADRRLVSAPWTRVDEDLFFHYRGWRGAFITPAHVSTMFHIDTIRERLGHWDAVRKAADTEFILRYRTLVQADEPLEVCEAPLTLSLVSHSNLSIDDFRLGYRAPDRVAYRDSYEHWHSRIRAGKHNGYLPFPQTERAFPAPYRFLPDRHQSLQLDRLFVGDFGEVAGIGQRMFNDLRAASEYGLRIGLMHVPSLLHAQAIDKSFSSALLDAFAAGRLHRVEITDNVSSGTVSIYDPTAFQYSRELSSGHRAGQVNVHAHQPPYLSVSDEHKYDVEAVERNVAKVFGAPVTWVSDDPDIARVISQSRQVRVSTLELGDGQPATARDEPASLLVPTGSNTFPSS